MSSTLYRNGVIHSPADPFAEAVLVSHVGTRYVIRNAAWNPVIPAGGRVELGFQGAPGNVTAGPTDYVLNGERLP